MVMKVSENLFKYEKLRFSFYDSIGWQPTLKYWSSICACDCNNLPYVLSPRNASCFAFEMH